MADLRVVLAAGTVTGAVVLRPTQDKSHYAIHSQGLHDLDVRALVLDPRGGLYAGAANGVVYHSDDAQEWKPRILDRPGIWALSLHPAEPDTLLAGSAPAAIFRSHDGGRHWHKCAGFNKVKGSDQWTHPLPPYLSRARTIVHHPEYPQVAFVGIKTGGLVGTMDGGDTWTERQGGLSRDINQLLMHPADPARIYAATDAGLFRSDDLGANWKEYSKGLPYPYLRALAVDEENPDHLIAGVNRTVAGEGASLFRSRDGGQHWQILESFPTMPQAGMTALCSSRGRFFAATDHGELFGSVDFGDHWHRFDTHLPAVHALLALA